jgi:hypothetical protein
MDTPPLPKRKPVVTDAHRAQVAQPERQVTYSQGTDTHDLMRSMARAIVMKQRRAERRAARDTAGENAGSPEITPRNVETVHGRASYWLTRTVDESQPDGYSYEGPGVDPWEIGAV